jgi:hypothetical protein
VPPNVTVAKDRSIYAFTSSSTVATFAQISVTRSADGGTTWRRTVVLKGHPSGATGLDNGPLAVDPANPNIALATVGAHDKYGSSVCLRLLKTDDAGRTWQPAERGLVAPANRCPLG